PGDGPENTALPSVRVGRVRIFWTRKLSCAVLSAHFDCRHDIRSDLYRFRSALFARWNRVRVRFCIISSIYLSRGNKSGIDYPCAFLARLLFVADCEGVAKTGNSPMDILGRIGRTHGPN